MALRQQLGTLYCLTKYSNMKAKYTYGIRYMAFLFIMRKIHSEYTFQMCLMDN